jgi:hypothetical protein
VRKETLAKTQSAQRQKVANERIANDQGKMPMLLSLAVDRRVRPGKPSGRL